MKRALVWQVDLMDRTSSQHIEFVVKRSTRIMWSVLVRVQPLQTSSIETQPLYQLHLEAKLPDILHKAYAHIA